MPYVLAQGDNRICPQVESYRKSKFGCTGPLQNYSVVNGETLFCQLAWILRSVFSRRRYCWDFSQAASSGWTLSTASDVAFHEMSICDRNRSPHVVLMLTSHPSLLRWHLPNPQETSVKQKAKVDFNRTEPELDNRRVTNVEDRCMWYTRENPDLLVTYV